MIRYWREGLENTTGMSRNEGVSGHKGVGSFDDRSHPRRFYRTRVGECRFPSYRRSECLSLGPRKQMVDVLELVQSPGVYILTFWFYGYKTPTRFLIY